MMKLVVDVDAGIDDAIALMLLLARKDVEIVAVTTVGGNTTTTNASSNVLRVLEAAGRLDIPVFEGCQSSFLGQSSPGFRHHGSDGFGDNPNIKAADRNHLKKQHAALRLLELSRELEGELVLVALAPMTNIAVALRLDPDFGRRLKTCFIMGGTASCSGNISATSEFNFWFDPEAAYVSINELGCPITVIGWEVCLACAWPWTLFQSSLLEGESRSVQLIRDAEWNFVTRVNHPERNITADAVCVAVILHPELVLARSHLPGRVFVAGEARGALALDRRSNRAPKDWTKLDVVEKVDVEGFRRVTKELIHRLP